MRFQQMLEPSFVTDGFAASYFRPKLLCPYVEEGLGPHAEAGEALMVVTRHSAKWGLPESSHVIRYMGSEKRAAHLTPNSRGGKRIAAFARERRP